MELPSHLKKLYRHWALHVGEVGTPYPKGSVFLDLETFIKERISIWKKKTSRIEAPYTEDKILSTYRFCNVFREFDKQTIEFHTLLNPLRENFPLWLINMFYCRMVSRVETVKTLGLLNLNDNKKLYEKFLKLNRPKFGDAYIFPISTIQRSRTPTRELFLTQHLQKVIKPIADEIQTWHKIPVTEGLKRVLPIFGFNHEFLWTEVLIDVAYQYPEKIDLFANFPVGPGARPTMNRAQKTPLELSKFNLNTGLTYEGKPLRLSAENWEGIFCEFRKYTNLKNGRGRKRLYRPSVRPHPLSGRSLR